MELSVIGVLMASDAVGRVDVSDWTALHGEQQRTEYRSLGYSDFQVTPSVMLVQLMLVDRRVEDICEFFTLKSFTDGKVLGFVECKQ